MRQNIEQDNRNILFGLILTGFSLAGIFCLIAAGLFKEVGNLQMFRLMMVAEVMVIFGGVITAITAVNWRNLV